MHTLISHFFNESYLLPWWLRHHRELFEHGVLIDYDSTDGSVDICRELVPHWTVVSSRNREFGALACDLEVMDAERGLRGWKMALNTSEFLCVPDLSQLTSSLAARGERGVMVPAAIMVDDPAGRPALSTDVPLVQQVSTGYLEFEQPGVSAQRARLLHDYPDGDYLIGRHGTHRAVGAMERLDAVVMWLQYAPATPEVRRRKLQIGGRIPSTDVSAGLGAQHLRAQDQMMAAWTSEYHRAEDLRTRPEIALLVMSHGGATDSGPHVETARQSGPAEPGITVSRRSQAALDLWASETSYSEGRGISARLQALKALAGLRRGRGRAALRVLISPATGRRFGGALHRLRHGLRAGGGPRA